MRHPFFHHIRDSTKAGAAAGKGNHLWRIHRAYRKPERMAAVLQAGAAVVVRAGWRSARWPREDGTPFDLIDALDEATGAELIDQPIWLGRKSGAPLAPRLVALKKPAQAAARRKARRDAPRERHQVSRATLVAADWVILITSLTPKPCSTQDGLALYRLRWRIELGFKRLKSVLGLRRPPGTDARSARPYLLAHLLLILLLRPLSKAFEDSPRWANAA